MKVAIGCDHGGLLIKEEVKHVMEELNLDYIDLGCDSVAAADFSDYAIPVAEKVGIEKWTEVF